MNLRRVVTMITMVVGVLVEVFAGDVMATDVTAKQRYPWNGLVDITCNVTGIEGETNGLNFAIAVVMPDSSRVCNISHFWVVRGGTNSTDREVYANGNYHLIWNARADLGIVRYTNMVVRVNFDTHEKVQLWENGPYWATTNIGAKKPWEYGCLFWWGDTVGYMREGDSWVASNGSSANFSFGPENTPTFKKSAATLLNEGWITEGNVLAPEHDAAHIQWGGAWRMPTYQEICDLIGKCDWTNSTMDGVSGILVRGRGDYATASIFLPFVRGGSHGHCWTSSVWEEDDNGYIDGYIGCHGSYVLGWGVSNGSIYYYYAFSDNTIVPGSGSRTDGECIRPVQGGIK